MNQWYYAQNGTQQGPVSGPEFLDLVRAGTINAGTLIWRVGMDEWQTYGRVPDAPHDAMSPLVPPPLAPEGQVSAAPLASGMGPVPVVPIKIPNYLVWSILATICCCPAGGIPALVYSARVNSKIAAGDIPGAMEASKKARMWCWIALGLAVVLNALSIPLADMLLSKSLGSLLQNGGY